MTNSRNLILAAALSFMLLFGWDAVVRYLYPQPATPPATATAQASGQPDVGSPQPGATPASGDTAKIAHSRAGGLMDPKQIALEKADLKTALASPDRIPIDAPRVAGSINLDTGTIDDLVLKDYRETVDKNSPPVRLFSPQGTPAQQFAEFGFLVNGKRLPAGKWQADGTRLTPTTPVTLHRQGPDGIGLSIKLSIDKDYMIHADQRVDNSGSTNAVVQPFALINRTDRNASQDLWIAHSGPIGMFNDAADYDVDYKDLGAGQVSSPSGKIGWMGFTDIYWLSALVPQAGAQAKADFRGLGDNLFRADLVYAPISVPAGRAASVTTQLFAGAKASDILSHYEKAGIPKFDLAIDWGWFRWFEQPFLWLLNQLFHLAGNFGVAIILLTVIVRGALFPIAQKQFASMAAMKAIQPRMKAIQEKYKDDKMKQQQEMQKLFKDEGVNPLAGCLPMLLQAPILFALYKVFVLAIEMRHQPFILWIKDLSAPDPATVLNLFGLLPFHPTGFLAIGVLALLLGFTMWLTFRLNPAPADPVQQKMFSIMPWMMMFVMAPFAAGLLLYWTTSNLLTIAQQKYLYSRHPQLRAAVEKERKAVKAAAD